MFVASESRTLLQNSQRLFGAKNALFASKLPVKGHTSASFFLLIYSKCFLLLKHFQWMYRQVSKLLSGSEYIAIHPNNKPLKHPWLSSTATQLNDPITAVKWVK